MGNRDSFFLVRPAAVGVQNLNLVNHAGSMTPLGE